MLQANADTRFPFPFTVLWWPAPWPPSRHGVSKVQPSMFPEKGVTPKVLGGGAERAKRNHSGHFPPLGSLLSLEHTSFFLSPHTPQQYVPFHKEHPSRAGVSVQRAGEGPRASTRGCRWGVPPGCPTCP